MVEPDVKQAISLLLKDSPTRALRTTALFRSSLNKLLLKTIIETHACDNAYKSSLLTILEKTPSDAMHLDSPSIQTQPVSETTPEIDIYLGYLLVLFLHDQNQIDLGMQTTKQIILPKLSALNKRSLDILAARIFFYLARFYELKGEWMVLRNILLELHRTATLRHDVESQATLLNSLLRNYLHFSSYDQADKLVSKTTFPESTCSNNQLARYYYYLGRIKAIQLDYTAAHMYLLQASRKALQSVAGFQQAVHKVMVVVQLLMGEIPERSLFFGKVLNKCLAPYLSITSAVKRGDLQTFQKTLQTHTLTFQSHKTYTLILRLRHNVIKTGIRSMSLSYSRISLRDTCLKLQLDSEEDAEYVIAKAIRDGVVDALIDHVGGWMKSKENQDIYTTNEPQIQFHQRIAYCLNLHNESVQGMRYPMNNPKPDEMALQEQLVEEGKKLAKEIVEGDEDDEMEF